MAARRECHSRTSSPGARVEGSTEISFGSNPDVTADLLPLVDAARASGPGLRDHRRRCIRQMPFMTGHAMFDPARFDWLVDDARYDYDLYCPPNPPIGTVDHAIGMHVSALVRDGGTLQVGIGELGDALVYALLLRHQQNAVYSEALRALGTEHGGALHRCRRRSRSPSPPACSPRPRCSSTRLLDLYRAGIASPSRVRQPRRSSGCLRRGAISERIDETAARSASLRSAWARAFGSGIRRAAAVRRVPERCANSRTAACAQPAEAGSRRISADAAARGQMAEECLGRELRNGQVLHAGFFLGPRGFYAALRELPESDRSQFGMRGVAYVNQLYGRGPGAAHRCSGAIRDS